MPSKIEQNRQKLLQGIDAGILTPTETPQKPNPSGLPGPGDTKNPASTPFLRAAIPAGFQLGTDTFRAFQKNTLPGVRIAPLPASLDKNIGASAKSQIIVQQTTSSGLLLEVNNVKTPSQTIANFKGSGISFDAFGGIIFTASTGDGLTHGTLPWEYDPSFFLLREDFTGVSESSTNSVAVNVALGQWALNGNASSTISGIAFGAPPNLGYIWSADNGTRNSGVFLTPNMYAAEDRFSTGAPSSLLMWSGSGMALMENPGWQATFVFGFNNCRGVGAFSNANMNAYIGLFGITMYPQITNATTSSNRPDQFIGVRFDTYAAQGPFTITSVANHSGSTTTYTGTFVATSAQAHGQFYTIAGFTNPANNGTFYCTAVSATTMTVINNAGVAETHAATATQSGTAGGDTFFVLEVVNNTTLNSGFGRNNTQGTTLVTSISPTQNSWHRLDIACTAAGVVTLTLDGTATLTATLPQTVISGSGSWLTGVLGNNFATLSWTAGLSNAQPALSVFGQQSLVTIAGFTSSWTPLNATFPLALTVNNGSSPELTFPTTHAAVGGSQAANATITGYPSFIPGFMIGDNNTVAAGQNFIWMADYCALIWNPNLGGSAPGTINATKSRYFSTPSNP